MRWRSAGPSLMLTGRRADVLEPLASEVGGRAIEADLSVPDAPERLLAEAGEVDVLVANAGLPGCGRADVVLRRGARPRAERQPARADAAGARARPIRWSRAAAGTCCSCRRLSGRAGAPRSSVYSATKFGLRGFALALREDLAPKGVGVSVVLPGFIRDAGMFADSGAKLPPFVGTKRPEDVARAVVKAIEHNRAELDVAPLPLRAGALLAGLAPGPVGAIQRRLGATKTADSIGGGQTDKR